MSVKRIFITCILWLGLTITLLAQNGPVTNPLLYSQQAVELGDVFISHDPVTMVMPGVALGTGFGSYLDNPASAALFRDSYGSFGFVYRNVDEMNTYLGNRNSLTGSQTGINNLGFVYRIPTVQGSLVVGAGYTQHSFFNRSMSVSGRNNLNTITDAFKFPGSYYGDIAFNTYAIDYGDEFEDWDESIFRIGFAPGSFPGINQDAEITQRGYGGEYSAFLATEFQQNLMVGVSLGVFSSNYSYDRVFLEVDQLNDYDGDFIDTGSGGSDIDSILLTDEIRSSGLGFRMRAGLLYKASDFLHIGASYTLPTRVTVEELYDSRIRTTFDNGVEFSDDISGEFDYKFVSPSRFNVGVAMPNIGPLTLSASAEYVNHSKTKIEFNSDLFEEERIENREILNNYNDVWNLRGGVAYDVNPGFTIRGGYAYYPSKFINGTDDKSVISAGLGFAVSRDTRLEIGAQYSMWNERSSLYRFAEYDYSPLPNDVPNFTIRDQAVANEVNRLQIMATLKIRLD